MKATLGARGQVVIPKPIRDRMALRPGQELEFEEHEGRIVVRKVLPNEDPIAAVYGTFPFEEGWNTDRAMVELRGPVDLPPEG